MEIITTHMIEPGENLEEYRPGNPDQHWDLVASGFWGEDMYHSGHIAYFITRNDDGIWVMDGVERNAELDDVTQEDVDNCALNDDQRQALHGYESLDAAKNAVYRRIVAIIKNAPDNLTAPFAAVHLYRMLERYSGKIIVESDKKGFLIINLDE
jgi:hypothetical protein